MNSPRAECPVCGSQRTEPVLHLPQIPVFCNLLWPERSAALAAPRGDMRLGLCNDCGHLFNQAFDPGLMTYDQAYENSLHFSPSFQRYARGLAETLVERYDLHGKDIIEIGCGQGDFLGMLCELGNNRGVGFDPAYVEEGALPPNVTIIPDYYSEKYASHRADFLVSRHVIEHLARPRAFAAMLRRVMAHRPDAVLFIEAPSADYMVAHTALWDIIYEHYAYFGRASMTRLFEDAGFQTLDLYETFGGQYLCLEARPAASSGQPATGREDVTAWRDQVRDFARSARAEIARWRRELERLAAANKRVVVWGAGSKGVMFLNLLPPQARLIDFVVDINPRKQGKFVAGAGQQIVSPDFLRDYRPDVIILMNRNYQDEIQEMAAALGLSPEFRFV